MRPLSSPSPATAPTAVTTDTAVAAPPDEGPACPVSWNALGSTVAMGLGTVYLVNRIAPPRSWTVSLMRYAIGLVPAMMYLANTHGLNQLHARADQHSLAGQRPVALADLASQYIIEVTPFSLESTQERQHQNQLGITRRSHEELEAIYLAAWLEHNSPATLFDARREPLRFKQHIGPIAQATTNLHSQVALVTQARKSGWYTLPLPESHLCHTHSCPVHAEVYQTPPDVPAFAFHWVPANARHCVESPLPLDQLNISDVLVLTHVFEMMGEVKRRLTGLQRVNQKLFVMFNPRKGLSYTTTPALLQNLVRAQLAMSDRASIRVEMMQLQYNPGRPEQVQARGPANADHA